MGDFLRQSTLLCQRHFSNNLETVGQISRKIFSMWRWAGIGKQYFEWFSGVFQHTEPKDDQWDKNIRPRSSKWWIPLEFSGRRSFTFPWSLVRNVLRGYILHFKTQLTFNRIVSLRVFEVVFYLENHIDMICKVYNEKIATLILPGIWDLHRPNCKHDQLHDGEKSWQRLPSDVRPWSLLFATFCKLEQIQWFFSLNDATCWQRLLTTCW